jgi:hypothetical protein
MSINLPAAFAGIANRVSAAFGGPYFDGLIIMPGNGGGIDDDGVFQPGSPGGKVPCRVQVVDADEVMRESEGFADGDALMLILSDGLGIDLTTDMKVKITAGPRAGTWMISDTGRDSAGIGWSAKGRRA